MTMREFIRDNRKGIDEVIYRRISRSIRINDKDRQQWILNDERLYDWARSERVRI